MIVKICGITNPDDGLQALQAGADWLGFIRHPQSPRYRPPAELTSLVHSLRRQATRVFQAVGVYVDAPLDVMLAECEAARFDRIQLHGTEPMELAQALPVPVIKAIKVAAADSIRVANVYPGLDLLTDTPDPVLHGGTGKGYDLSLIEELVRTRRVLVAGGLTPDNVGDVVRWLRPFGVDVSSGVEHSPGVKDAHKMLHFVSEVRLAAGESDWKEHQ